MRGARNAGEQRVLEAGEDVALGESHGLITRRYQAKMRQAIREEQAQPSQGS